MDQRHDSERGPGGNNLRLAMVIATVCGVLLFMALFFQNTSVHLKSSEFKELVQISRGMGTQKTALLKDKYEYRNLHDISLFDEYASGTATRRLIAPTDAASAKEEEVTVKANFEKGSIEGLVKVLEEKDDAASSIAFDYVTQTWRSYFLPFLLLAVIIFFCVMMMRRMTGTGSAMAFGRSRAKLYAQEELGVTFDDVAGIDEAVEEVREVVDFLRTPEKYHKLGGRIPKGVMLVGPPGTGKTLLAKAIAGEAAVPFFSLSGSDFVEMFVGVGAARVRDMFQQAEQKAPCIIFIDELDALGKTRGANPISGQDEREQTLNALLVEMDGFESNSGVIVLAASNRPETLDPALLRPGRFDRHVLVDRPDIKGREKILKVHVKNVKLSDDVELHQVASITSGFVGADLANLVNEAALLAARANKNSVSMVEFNDGVERVTAGLEKKQRVIHEDEKSVWRITKLDMRWLHFACPTQIRFTKSPSFLAAWLPWATRCNVRSRIDI